MCKVGENFAVDEAVVYRPHCPHCDSARPPLFRLSHGSESSMLRKQSVLVVVTQLGYEPFTQRVRQASKTLTLMVALTMGVYSLGLSVIAQGYTQLYLLGCEQQVSVYLPFGKDKQSDVKRVFVTHASFGLSKSITQAASRSVQPFLQGSRSLQTDRPTDHAKSVFSNRPHLASAAMLPSDSLDL